MVTFRPQAKAWLPLLIVALPIAGVGVAALIDGAFIGLLAIAFAAVIVGYNSTIRLTIADQQISLKRFGLTVWSAPKDAIRIENGRGGDVPIMPAYLFIRHSQQIGYVLRGWFREEDIATLRAMLTKGC